MNNEVKPEATNYLYAMSEYANEHDCSVQTVAEPINQIIEKLQRYG